jgi:hypothetical protein
VCNSIFGWVPYVVQDMWADILEDAEFMHDLKEESRKVLAKHFSILKAFLEKWGVPYYENV